MTAAGTRKLKHDANERRKQLSAEMMPLRLKRNNGTATEFDLEQLYELTGEYQALMENEENYE